METLKLIIEILLAGAGVTLFAAGRQLVKEIKDVVKTYKEAQADGDLSEAELVSIGKESIEALISALSFWKLLKKTFSGIFKKKS